MPVLPDVASTIVAAGFEQPVALGRVDHRDADAILDRVSRIQALHLGEDLRLDPWGQAVEFDERRVADEAHNVS